MNQRKGIFCFFISLHLEEEIMLSSWFWAYDNNYYAYDTKTKFQYIQTNVQSTDQFIKASSFSYDRRDRSLRLSIPISTWSLWLERLKLRYLLVPAHAPRRNLKSDPNASNVFVHTTWRNLKRNNHWSFWICERGAKLNHGSPMIIVAPSVSKNSVFILFPSTRTEACVSKFSSGLTSVFLKLRFRS